MRRPGQQSGSVLILSLWILTVLTLFVVHTGLRIRQRISFLSTIEEHQHLRDMAQAGIQKGIAALRADWQQQGGQLSVRGKMLRHHYPTYFKGIALGQGYFDVTYYEGGVNGASSQVSYYGLVDEERKINVNIADQYILTRLFSRLSGLDERQRQSLVRVLINWREIGQTQLEGFYSDDYYENLEYPYSSKDAEFELLDELLLLEGMTEELWEQLLSLITIYGDGFVNINTAPLDVLVALGLEEDVARKVIAVRRGEDGLEATPDDHIFMRTFDVVSDMKIFTKLTPEEIRQIDGLNARQLIKADATFYSIYSMGYKKDKSASLTIHAVYNLHENRIESWQEK